jgi:prephenate dehydrogenase
VKLGRLTVVGVGLIGGSFALALKRAGAVERVVGLGRSRANLDRALALGVIDEIAPDAASACLGADLVLLAVPVAQTAPMLRQLAPHLPSDCVVTDGGSTKQDVVAAAQAELGARLPYFVPAHPIAGAEQSGVEAASAGLYDGRLVVTTPLPQTAASAVRMVEAAWTACGARVVQLTPQRHDEVFAAVSHLPHALAFALVEMIAARPEAQQLFSFAGAGFRDFTRIASSSPEMWRDICIANRPALLREIEAFRAALEALAQHLRAGDAQALARLFERARDARDSWLQSMGAR